MTRTIPGVTGEDVSPSSLPPVARLSALLRDRTTPSHRMAERSGIVADILSGAASRDGYALYLRNLLPAYVALETAQYAGSGFAALDKILPRELCRAAAIEHDLVSIAGDDWRRLPLLASGTRYADRIAKVGAADPASLIAHAYVRYLGDLSGGQIMMRLLGRTLGLELHQLAFYAFPEIADLAHYKSAYREAIDAIELDAAQSEAIADEAVSAFDMNIALSLEVQDAAIIAA
jgi:heme oxygenase (biliverdin-producing, ferredoxin)